MYGQEAMLSMEINLKTCRVALQDTMSAEDYAKSMMERVDETLES
jgi:hypothetical protein